MTDLTSVDTLWLLMCLFDRAFCFLASSTHSLIPRNSEARFEISKYLSIPCFFVCFVFFSLSLVCGFVIRRVTSRLFEEYCDEIFQRVPRSIFITISDEIALEILEGFARGFCRDIRDFPYSRIFSDTIAHDGTDLMEFYKFP